MRPWRLSWVRIWSEMGVISAPDHRLDEHDDREHDDRPEEPDHPAVDHVERRRWLAGRRDLLLTAFAPLAALGGGWEGLITRPTQMAMLEAHGVEGRFDFVP